jgi:crossover junction endodeoxyribonuclease RuvC
MLALGVDPGTAITGYGLVTETGGQLQSVAYGVITTPSDWPLPQRLQKIYRDLTALVREHHPTEGAVEQLFFSRNVKTALVVGQVPEKDAQFEQQIAPENLGFVLAGIQFRLAAATL